MRSIDSGTYNALVNAPENGLVERDLVWITAKTQAGGSAGYGFWNDLDTVTVSVIDPATGVTVNRDFTGDGSIIAIDRIPLTSDLTVRTITVTLSPLHKTVEQMVRGNDVRNAPVIVYRLLFDPATHSPVGAAIPHFVGFVNKAPIGTPKVGEEASIELSVVSVIRELTKTNPAKKSDETQRRRSGDRMYRYLGTADVPIFWGRERQRPSGGKSPQRKLIDAMRRS